MAFSASATPSPGTLPGHHVRVLVHLRDGMAHQHAHARPLQHLDVVHRVADRHGERGVEVAAARRVARAWSPC